MAPKSYIASLANAARLKKEEAKINDIVAEEVNATVNEPILETPVEGLEKEIPTLKDTSNIMLGDNTPQQDPPQYKRPEMEKIEENIKEGEGANFYDPKKALDQAVAREGIVNAETGTVSYDEQVASLATTEELQNQKKRQMIYNRENLTFETPDEGLAALKLTHVSRSGITGLTDASADLGETLGYSIKSGLTQNVSDLATRLKNFLVANKLLDDNGNLTSAVINATTLAMAETIQDDVNKRSQEERGRYNESMSNGVGFNENLFDTEDSQSSVTGKKINPDFIRGNVARGVLDKVLDNPNIVDQDEGIMVGQGGPSAGLDAELLDVFDTILQQAMLDSGYITHYKVTDPLTNKIIEEKYIISDKGDAFFNAVRPLIKILQKDKRIDVSNTPSIGEGRSLPGFERIRRDAGAYSLKSMMDENLAIENVTKQILGKISYTIAKDRFNFVKRIVFNLMKINENSGYVESLTEMSPIGFFSTSQWATTIGLDEGKWRKSEARAYNYQLAINGNDKSVEAEKERKALAAAQADRVMRAQAKEIYQTILDADGKLNKTFYNKIFHATAVGRYFVRNTVLNPLDSKIVRNIVGSTKVNMVDVKNGFNNDNMEDFMYIIGKNLLKEENTSKNQATEDMGWNAVIADSKKIFKSGISNPTYATWLRTGRLLKMETNKGINRDDITLETLNVILGKDGANELGAFQKADEWGYKFQSFIDFANWHEANENYKKGMSNTKFRTYAQTQHDGKQSGIAIQARQNADIDFLKLVGVIYNDEENVLPQGDIRTRFMNMLPQSIGIVFQGNLDKKAMWESIFIEFAEKGIDIKKALSKVPLMETSYGKSAMFNQETVVNVINTPAFMQVIERNHLAAENLGNTYNRGDLINDMNHLIEVNLGLTLNFTHQKILANLGTLWSMLSGIVPSYEGPLGTHQFLGGRENSDTGKTITIETPYGSVDRKIKRSVARGDRQSRSNKLKFNQEENKFEISKMSPYTQEIANQIAVLPIQQIDAAIMSLTIRMVNKGLKQPKFLIPIHDAIITDIDSVREYHATINSNFETVNKKYKVARAVRTGYSKDYSAMLKQLNKQGDYLLSSDTPLGPLNPNRAIHSWILNEFNKEQNKEDLKYKPINDVVRLQKGKSRANMLKEVKKLGWTVDGGMVKGYQIIGILNQVQSYLQVYMYLEQWERQSKIKETKMLTGSDLINKNRNYHTN